MTFLLSAAFLSCSFFNSSAAFFLRSNCKEYVFIQTIIFSFYFTLNFFFLSGVMNPFFAFLPAAWASRRARTSAFLRSISACFLHGEDG